MEYPGYSIYNEDKNSDTILNDSLIVYDFIIEELKINSNNIYVFGRSLGSGPSLYLSSNRNPGGLILISPFTSIQMVAESLVGKMFKYLINERYLF